MIRLPLRLIFTFFCFKKPTTKRTIPWKEKTVNNNVIVRSKNEVMTAARIFKEKYGTLTGFVSIRPPLL